jgi:hypothetical protein
LDRSPFEEILHLGIVVVTQTAHGHALPVSATDKLPCSLLWRNSRIVAAFVSRILSMINLPRESVHADILLLAHNGAPFGRC